MISDAALTFDVAAAYPEVAVVRDRLAGRDWAGVREVLDGLPPAGRTKLIEIGGEQTGIEHHLRNVLERDPADGAAAAMLGFRLIKIGWAVRSHASAEFVSAEQFAQFHDWLRQAEAVLIDGTARSPRDPALWTARVLSARGLQVGLAETRRRFDRVTALDPHHLPAQTLFLQSLCPKWNGSWEMLHPWSRESMLAAPPGSVQGLLVARAHVEHWLSLDDLAGTAYLNGTAVREDIYEAARYSVLHPAFGRDYGWVNAVSNFAFLFSLIGDRRTAATMFGLLGHLASEDPWGYLGDGAEIFRTHRRRALNGATR